MTTATASRPLTANPIDLDEHKAELQQIRDQQKKQERILLECLNPAVAAELEARKPVFIYGVKMKLRQFSKAKARMITLFYEEDVAAQNENDAWATFCDKKKFARTKDGKPCAHDEDEEPLAGPWPSRRSAGCKVVIEQGQQIDAAKALSMLAGSGSPIDWDNWDDEDF